MLSTGDPIRGAVEIISIVDAALPMQAKNDAATPGVNACPAPIKRHLAHSVVEEQILELYPLLILVGAANRGGPSPFGSVNEMVGCARGPRSTVLPTCRC